MTVGAITCRELRGNVLLVLLLFLLHACKLVALLLDGHRHGSDRRDKLVDTMNHTRAHTHMRHM